MNYVKKASKLINESNNHSITNGGSGAAQMAILQKSKNDTSLGGDAIRLTVSKVITLLITTVSSMLLSRFRTYEEYGTYSQLLLVINLFTSLLMLGLPSSINYFLARAETQREKQAFLSVYYTLSTLLSIVVGLVLALSVPVIESFFHNPLIRKFYYFLALYPWASIICSSIENILIVYKKTNLLMAYKVIYSISSLGTVFLVQILGFGFDVYMVIFVAVNALFAISIYIIVSKLCGRLSFLVDKKLIRTVFIFSVPIGLASVVGTLNTEIDKLMIGYLLNTEQMAIYTNAAKELPLTIVASSITAVLLPQLTRMIKQTRTLEAIKLWGVATELSFMLIAFVVAGMFTYADEVITILYSEKYIPGVDVFRVYTLTLLLRTTYFGIVLNAYGETKKIFWCSIISLILNILLNPLFFWLFGMVGPALATFISILMVQQLQLIMTSKVTQISFSRVFPWKRIMIIIMINIVIAFTFWMIKRLCPMEIILGEVGESILFGIVWSVLYLWIMKRRIMDRWHLLNS